MRARLTSSCCFPLQACPRFGLEAQSFVLVFSDPDDPQIMLAQVDLCLEPNQMTPQALHASTGLLRLASWPLTEKRPNVMAQLNELHRRPTIPIHLITICPDQPF